jgi:hypothetical protein
VANGIVYVGTSRGIGGWDAISGSLLWHRLLTDACASPAVVNAQVLIGDYYGMNVFLLEDLGSAPSGDRPKG